MCPQQLLNKCITTIVYFSVSMIIRLVWVLHLSTGIFKAKFPKILQKDPWKKLSLVFKFLDFDEHFVSPP